MIWYNLPRNHRILCCLKIFTQPNIAGASMMRWTGGTGVIDAVDHIPSIVRQTKIFNCCDNQKIFGYSHCHHIWPPSDPPPATTDIWAPSNQTNYWGFSNQPSPSSLLIPSQNYIIYTLYLLFKLFFKIFMTQFETCQWYYLYFVWKLSHEDKNVRKISVMDLKYPYVSP